jgi:hypothetical protein
MVAAPAAAHAQQCQQQGPWAQVRQAGGLGVRELRQAAQEQQQRQQAAAAAAVRPPRPLRQLRARSTAARAPQLWPPASTRWVLQHHSAAQSVQCST